MWQPDYQRKLLTRRRVVYAGIVAAAAVVSGGIIAHKLATRRGAPQADLSSMPTTQTSYTGEPLFKVNDAQNPGWALATKNGQIICKPQTSREIGNVCEGVCSCYSDLAERYGFIAPGEHGSYAWRVLPQFAAVGDYSQGLAAAKDPETRLWGYIDIDGNWQIPPQFKEAQPFSNGVAAVLSNSVDALWGAVDTHGTWTIEPAFAALGMSNEAGYMTAQASHGQDSARSWGFVDAHGSWSCSPNFPALRRLSSGCAPAAHPKTGLWGYVDAQGTWLIRPCFKDARPFSEDAAAVQDAKSQLWYFIDATGQAADAMKPTFWKLGELVCGLAPAQASAADDTVVFDDGSKAHGAQMRYGYVDSSGTWHMKRLVTLADTAIGYPRI